MGRLRNQAQKLEGLGLEVVLLLLDNRLQPGIERLICEARDKVHLVQSLISKYILLLFRLNSINASWRRKYEERSVKLREKREKII